MTDYLVQVKVRNNNILKRIYGSGYKSIAKFAQDNGIAYYWLCSLMSFRVSPTRENGDWSDATWDLSSALKCEPEDLFTDRQREAIMKKQTHFTVSEFDAVQIASRADSPHKVIEDKQFVELLSSGITEREKRVGIVRFKA